MTLDFIDEPFNREQLFQELKTYFDTFEHFILYHGTSTVFKEPILKEGLQCRRITKNSVYEGRELEGRNLESNPELVYVGSLCTAHYLGTTTPKKYGGELIIFQVLLEKKDLLPDEDSEKTNGIESLARLGSASIQTHIPTEQIIGYNTTYTRRNSERIFTPLRKTKEETIRFTRKRHKLLLEETEKS